MKQTLDADINTVEGTSGEREKMMAYLLGELPEEAESAFEQEYLAVEETFDRLLVVEDELTYDYVQQRLSDERRRKFETTLGATERGQRKVEFARALMEMLQLSRAPTPRTGMYWMLAIAAALVLSALPLWMVSREARLNAEIEKLRTDVAAAAARTAPAVTTPPIEARFLLTMGRSRGSDEPTILQAPAKADVLRFELVLPPDTASVDFVVTARVVGGAVVWSRSEKLSGATASVSAPAASFPSGSYVISLRRMTAGEQLPDLASYPFRIVRK
jgi:hypothetical protein